MKKKIIVLLVLCLAVFESIKPKPITIKKSKSVTSNVEVESEIDKVKWVLVKNRTGKMIPYKIVIQNPTTGKQHTKTLGIGPTVESYAAFPFYRPNEYIQNITLSLGGSIGNIDLQEKLAAFKDNANARTLTATFEPIK